VLSEVRVVPYWMVAQWVSSFHRGWDRTKDTQCAGQPAIPNQCVELIQSLLHADNHWMAWHLAADAGVRHIMALCILN